MPSGGCASSRLSERKHARDAATMSEREREIKLAAPLGFRMPDLSEPSGELTSGPVETIELDAVYYDTDDLRLARTGASLRHRNDEGWVVKLPRSTEGNGLLDRSTYSFAGADDAPPAEALDLVRGIVRKAPIGAVAHLHTTRRCVQVFTLEGARLAELTDDDVQVCDGDRLVDRFRELEIELADGVPADRVDEIVERLRAAGARPPEPTPKVVRALGPRAQGQPDLVPVQVGKGATVEEVLRAALSAAAAKLVASDAGIRTGDDPEDIHDARVATRRVRSHLRTFRTVVDEQWANNLRAELKWLGGLLGAVRDAEVLQARLLAKVDRLPESDQPAARRLLTSLDRQRTDGRKTLLDAMRSDRYLELLERVIAAAQRPRVLLRVEDEDDRKVMQDLARRPWNHLRDAVGDLPDEPADEELHAVRIRAKRARYAVEAVSPVFGKPARQFARALTDLQDVLGEHQDAVVAGKWLRDTAAATGEEMLGFVAGELVALERDDALHARAAWPKAWRAANRKRLHSWL